ncbi:MAG: PQQ-dependent sugar dehydrogenase [Planctomycetaceae bacterium]
MPQSLSVASLFASLAVLHLAASVRAAENTLTDAEKRAGWTLLFDGQTMKGWRGFRRDSIGAGWQAVDGTLALVTPGAGDLESAEPYDSFELSLEYKISKGGDSGVFFHVSEQADAAWKSGPEVEIRDNAVEGDGAQKSGWLHGLFRPSAPFLSSQVPDATHPAGEWNQIQLRVTPSICEINVNGIRYAMFQKGNAEWNGRVAKSKFKDFPEFGKSSKGNFVLQDHGNPVAFRNIRIRKLGPNGEAPEPIDGTLSGVSVAQAFPGLKWSGWGPVDENGRRQEFRPILLTHASDGSNRMFVPTQQGVIHVVRGPQATESKVFLDLRDRVTYNDRQNEEGFLGMAFHPRFKQTGEFFVYYTSSKLEPHTSVVSRFKVSAADPDKADLASEEILLKKKQPYWNHAGGTIAFGPDGFLYVGLGDGGSANDPHNNGQNLGTWLGKILRIDVDHKEGGRNYAIPKDNPFVGKAGALPEIYALGVRNVWRLSFDRQTGALWCGDVGQNLWEEINLVVRGGNYGWNLREGTHPFGAAGSGPRADLIEPIWEYDHQVGSSITGGFVYRGKEVPELAGKYLYADYVTGKLWALTYDAQARKVVSNEAIPGPSPRPPVVSFGEDEQGEAYFMMVTGDGKGVYKLVRANRQARAD